MLEPKYKLEIFIGKNQELLTHENMNKLSTTEARLVVSVLEQYKQILLGNIMSTEQVKTQETPKPKKAE